MRPKNPEVTLESMLDNDKALERSVSFGACFVGLQNVMGDSAVSEIKELFLDKQLSDFSLKRSGPWDKAFPKKLDVKTSSTDYKAGDGEAPEGLIDNEKLSHNDMKVQNLIKVRIWDRTVWCGTGFAMYPDGTPELILLFEDEKAAQLIFDDLINEVGKEDRANRIRISIIRKINKKSPAHYRVCISEKFLFDDTKVVQMIARKNTMTPSTSDNLDNFLADYNTCKKYSLSYGIAKNGNILPPSGDRRMIIKFDIKVVDAWEVGPNDVEIVAIDRKDDPIIPDNVTNPPIIEALKRKFL
jgi:hypothetical protein